MSIMLVFMCLCVGFGSPYSTVGVSVLPEVVAKDFKKKATALYIAGVNLGCCTLPVISSLIFDKLGSYLPLYYTAVILGFVQLVVLTIVIPKTKIEK